MKVFSSILALFLSFSSFAQSLHFSKAQKFNSKRDMFEIGGWVQDRLWIFYSDKKDSYLDLYDANMERKAIVNLNFMPSNITQAKLLPQDNHCLFLYSAQINNKEFFYLAKLGTDAKIIGKPKSIDTAVQNFFGNTKHEYQLLHAENNKQVGVFSYKIKDNQLDFNITLANDSLQVTHSSNHKVPTKSYYGVSQVMLKSDGRIAILMTDLSTNKNDEVGEAMVYIIAPENRKQASLKALNFDFGEVFTGNLFLKEDASNENIIHFAGLTKGKKGNVDGIFSGKIDIDAPNNSKINGVASSIDTKAENIQVGNRIGNYVIREMMVKNDGGLVLAAEAYTKAIRTNYLGPSGYYGFGGYGSMGTTRYIDYYYGDILLLDINADQSLNWTNNIPKWQKTTDDYGMFSSYGTMNMGTGLAFVYNEMANKSYKVQASTLNINGEQDKSILAEQLKGDGKWVPRMGVQTQSREIVIPILSNSKLQFAKVVR